MKRAYACVFIALACAHGVAASHFKPGKASDRSFGDVVQSNGADRRDRRGSRDDSSASDAHHANETHAVNHTEIEAKDRNRTERETHKGKRKNSVGGSKGDDERGDRESEKRSIEGRSLLYACSSHDYCGEGYYCADNSGAQQCWACQWCYWTPVAGQDSITGTCPSKCNYAASCADLKGSVNKINTGDNDVANFNEYTGWCDAFSNPTNRWCATHGPHIDASCWAYDASQCCKTNGGAVVGVFFGLLIGITLIILLSAWCCHCCCFHQRVVVYGEPQPVHVREHQVVYVVPQGSPQPQYVRRV